MAGHHCANYHQLVPKYYVFEATRPSIPRELSCQADRPKDCKKHYNQAETVNIKKKVKKSMPKSKIDKGRALGIMGFSSSRPLDACLGDPEQIRSLLDEALYKKTQEILHAPVKHNAPRRPRLKKRTKTK